MKAQTLALQFQRFVAEKIDVLSSDESILFSTSSLILLHYAATHFIFLERQQFSSLC